MTPNQLAMSEKIEAALTALREMSAEWSRQSKETSPEDNPNHYMTVDGIENPFGAEGLDMFISAVDGWSWAAFDPDEYRRAQETD